MVLQPAYPVEAWASARNLLVSKEEKLILKWFPWSNKFQAGDSVEERAVYITKRGLPTIGRERWSLKAIAS
jgi:hypothetical protein